MRIKPQLTSLFMTAATFLVGSVSAFADEPIKVDLKDSVPVPTCVQLMDGFYVGVQAGYNTFRVREYTNNAAALLFGNTLSSNPAIGTGGYAAGVFGGWGMYINNRYYLGAEIFADGTGAFSKYNTQTATGSVYTNQFSASSSYGISFLPGIKLNNATLAYLRFGFNRGAFKGQEWSTPAGAPTAYDSQTKWGSGFSYGLGMESYLYHSLSLRTEFSHTNYSSLNNVYTSYNPSDNQFMLGLIYHFSPS